jgi:hypothetical protein
MGGFRLSKKFFCGIPVPSLKRVEKKGPGNHDGPVLMMVIQSLDYFFTALLPLLLLPEFPPVVPIDLTDPVDTLLVPGEPE